MDRLPESGVTEAAEDCLTGKRGWSSWFLANVEFTDLNFIIETTMTKLTIALTELVEKEVDAGLLKEIIQFVAQLMMEFDVEGMCGAGFDL